MPTPTRLGLFLCVCLLPLTLVACDDGGGETGEMMPGEPEPQPEPEPEAQPEPEPEPEAPPMLEFELSPDVFRVPIVEPGQIVERTVELRNTGDVPFNVEGFALDASPDFQLLYAFGERRPIIAIDFSGRDVGGYPLLVEAGATMKLTLEYRPPMAGMPSGELEVMTDLPEGSLIVPIEAVDAVGQLAVEPEAIVFGRVPPGETDSALVTVRNAGQAMLTIQNLAVQGDPDFTATVDGQPLDDVLADPDGDGMPGLAPGGSFDVEVLYAPMAEGLDMATLVVASDDPANPEVRVPLSGNDSTGCILIDPAEDFEIPYEEGVMELESVVTISNCGGQILTLDNVRLRAGTPPEVFNLAELPDFPFEIAPGDDALEVTIIVTPAGRVYTGALQIFSNDPDQPEIAIGFQAIPPGGGNPGEGMPE